MSFSSDLLDHGRYLNSVFHFHHFQRNRKMVRLFMEEMDLSTCCSDSTPTLITLQIKIAKQRKFSLCWTLLKTLNDRFN